MTVILETIGISTVVSVVVDGVYSWVTTKLIKKESDVAPTFVGADRLLSEALGSKIADLDKKADEHITQLTWHRNQEHGELTKAILDLQKDLAQVKETMRHFKDW